MPTEEELRQQSIQRNLASAVGDVTPPAGEAAPPTPTEPTEQPAATETPAETPATPPAEPPKTEPAEIEPEFKTITATEEPKPNEFDASKWLEETFGEKDVEALKSRLKTPPVQLSEAQKALLEWEEKGGDPKEFFRIQSTDWDKIDPLDAVRMDYKEKYPTLNREQIERLIKKQFCIGEEFDEDERALGEANLVVAHKTIIDAKKTQQKTFPLVDRTKANEEEQAKQKAMVEQWHETVDKTMKGFGGLEIQLDKDNKVEYKSSPEINQKVAEVMKNPAALFQYFPTPEALREGLFNAFEGKNLTKAIAKSYGSKQVATTLNKIENASSALPTQTPQGSDDKPKTPEEAARRYLMNKMSLT